MTIYSVQGSSKHIKIIWCLNVWILELHQPFNLLSSAPNHSQEFPTSAFIYIFKNRGRIWKLHRHFIWHTWRLLRLSKCWRELPEMSRFNKPLVCAENLEVGGKFLCVSLQNKTTQHHVTLKSVNEWLNVNCLNVFLKRWERQFWRKMVDCWVSNTYSLGRCSDWNSNPKCQYVTTWDSKY